MPLGLDPADSLDASGGSNFGKMKAGLMIFLLAVVLLLVATVAWVRLAPLDAEHWHRLPDELEAGDQSNSAIRVVDAGEGALMLLDDVIRATPRTEWLAGSVEDRMLTYVTRSAGFGFPDYTTVRWRNGMLEVFGRARYGLSDLGVNAARIDGWLDALRQGG